MVGLTLLKLEYEVISTRFLNLWDVAILWRAIRSVVMGYLVNSSWRAVLRQKLLVVVLESNESR